jgi:hypothetical protein
MITGNPMQWVRVHNLPDYAYFDHSIHVGAGVGCASCHGRIDEMVVVQQAKTLSMRWCIDCHRDPTMHLRPLNKVTDMSWTPPENQEDLATVFRDERNLNPSTDCSACHR